MLVYALRERERERESTRMLVYTPRESGR